MGLQPDAIDRRILNALLADGRASLREIARRIDVSPTTVSNRLGRLEDDGAISGYVPVLDYDTLGYVDGAVFRLKVAGSTHEAVRDRLERSASITAAYQVTGDFDLLAVGRFPDREAFSERVSELRDSADVERLVTHVVLATPIDGSHFRLAVD